MADRPLRRIHRAIRTSLRDAQPSRKRFGRSSGASARLLAIAHCIAGISAVRGGQVHTLKRRPHPCAASERAARVSLATAYSLQPSEPRAERATRLHRTG